MVSSGTGTFFTFDYRKDLYKSLTPKTAKINVAIGELGTVCVCTSRVTDQIYSRISFNNDCDLECVYERHIVLFASICCLFALNNL